MITLEFSLLYVPKAPLTLQSNISTGTLALHCNVATEVQTCIGVNVWCFDRCKSGATPKSVRVTRCNGLELEVESTLRTKPRSKERALEKSLYEIPLNRNWKHVFFLKESFQRDLLNCLLFYLLLCSTKACFQNMFLRTCHFVSCQISAIAENSAQWSEKHFPRKMELLRHGAFEACHSKQ